MTNRIYDATLAASIGASARIDAGGGYFRVLSAPGGPVGVKVDGGAEYQLLEGQGFRLVDGARFRDVTLRNLQAVAQTVQVFIGDATFEDGRVTGNVSVIDTNRQTTLNQRAFIGKQDANPGAAQFGVVQLANSPANTRRVIVETLHLLNQGTTQNLVVGISSNVATNLLGNGPSKLGGAAVPSSQATIRWTDNAGGIQSAFWGALAMLSSFMQANSTQGFDFRRPFILLPGYHLSVVNTVANAGFGAVFQWYEEDL